MAEKNVPHLRLLKVVVQPVVVVDDGTNLQEVAVDPITVPATEWPTYATNRFKKQLKELQDQLAESVEKAQTTQALKPAKK